MMPIRSLLLILLFSLSSAYSDVNHYNNILVGDRAATMGGAFTAIANDTSGTFYNPSGIAFYEGGGVSATANVYHLQYSRYDKAIRNYDWNRNSAELIPNFFGIIRTWDKHSFGLSIAVPDSFTQNQDQVLNDLPAMGAGEAIKKFAFNLHTQDSTYLIGPSYSYRLNDKMAIGVTLSYHYRKNRTLDYQTIWYTNTDYEEDNDVIELSENGIQPKLGFLVQITNELHAGIVLDHTFIASSKYTDQNINKTRATSIATLTNVTLNNKRSTTTHIGLGAAYYPNTSLLFSLDLDIYTAPDADIFFPGGYRNVVNVAVGSEYKINQRNAVRLGFFTNNSNMPKPTKDTLFVSQVDMYGIATGYSFTYSSTTFTAGFVYSAGSGYSQVYSGMDEVVKTYNKTFTGILSTSYNFD